MTTYMIKTIDKYLLKYFFLSLLAVTMAVGLTIVVINMVEELRDFIDHKVPLLSILEYYFYFAGWVLKSFTPMFVMLAVLFSFSILARRREILAMKACGLSLYRLAVPFVVVTLLISVGHFYYNEYIFPQANKKRLEIKEFTIERHSRSAHTKVRNVHRQISPGYFYMIAHFDVDRREGRDFKLYRTVENRLEEIVTAERIVYDKYLWHAIDGVRRTFKDGVTEMFVEFDSLIVADVKDEPADLGKWIGKPEDMGLEELKRYIDLMKRTGGPYVRESVDLKLKYSFPLASFIVILICIPFASNVGRGGIAISFATGALIALVYFILFRVMQSSGYNGKIPEDLAAWGVNGFFFVVGIILVLKARK